MPSTTKNGWRSTCPSIVELRKNVMGKETPAGVIDITEGPAGKRGVKHEVANGVLIPNLGELRFVGVTEYGNSY